MDKNAEKAYEDGFVAGMQHDAESRVSKFIDASMRKWVGLTGTEINHILAANVGYPERMMKEVEAQLKDKNNG